MAKLARSYLNPTDIGHVAAIKYGREQEAAALKQFEASSVTVTVKPVGLCVMQTKPHLAACPDGLIGEDTVLEIKCPFAARDRPINPTTVPFLEDTDGVLCLKNKHDYFFQVQGQMFVTGRSLCKFVVFTKVDMKVLLVKADKTFQENMMSKLDKFYSDFVKAAYLDVYFYKDYTKYSFLD